MDLQSWYRQSMIDRLMSWRLLMCPRWIGSKGKMLLMKYMYSRQWDILILLRIRSHSWIRGVCVLLWIMLMEEICIQRLLIKKKLEKFAIVKIRYWIGSFKWHWLSNIFMIEKFYIEILKHKIFLWIKTDLSKLEILVSLESCNTLMIVLKLLSVHHTIFLLKFAKRNHTIRNLIFGLLVVFSTKWLLSDMHLMPIQWKG